MPPLATCPATSILHRDPAVYLENIWTNNFGDVSRVNTIEIAYCYPWKRRLGLIRLSADNQTSFIGLNSLLQHADVPNSILVVTIAHELAHYTHGFGSPLTRRFAHPHANDVVLHELAQRGLGALLQLSDEWIDRNWFSFYDRERETGWAGIASTRRQRRSQLDIQQS